MVQRFVCCCSVILTHNSLSVCVCLCVCVCLSVCLSVCLPVCLPACLPPSFRPSRAPLSSGAPALCSSRSFHCPSSEGTIETDGPPTRAISAVKRWGCSDETIVMGAKGDGLRVREHVCKCVFVCYGGEVRFVQKKAGTHAHTHARTHTHTHTHTHIHTYTHTHAHTRTHTHLHTHTHTYTHPNTHKHTNTQSSNTTLS